MVWWRLVNGQFVLLNAFFKYINSRIILIIIRFLSIDHIHRQIIIIMTLLNRYYLRYNRKLPKSPLCQMLKMYWLCNKWSIGSQSKSNTSSLILVRITSYRSNFWVSLGVIITSNNTKVQNNYQNRQHKKSTP